MPKGPPHTPEDVDYIVPRPERPFVSDDAALDAMRKNQLEIVRVWYEQLQDKANEDPSPRSRTHLPVRMAHLQYAAGFPEMALGSLEAARQNARQLSDEEMVAHIDELIAEYSRR